VTKLQSHLGISERRACPILGQPRSCQRYEARPREDERLLVRRMLETARCRPRFGYRRVAALLRAAGPRASNSRILRLWRREGLRVPQKKRKRRRLGSSANGCQHRSAERQNHVWAWDFVFHRTPNGSALKWLSIVDEYTRECLALKVARHFTSEDVIDTLAELIAQRGVPTHIRSDNGPEFVAKAVQRWLAQLEVNALYIEPESPWENGYAESFHSRLRDEFLAMEVFDRVATARRLTASWREDYNTLRPHSSLGYVSPAEFAARYAASAPVSASATPQPALQQHSGNNRTDSLIAIGT
jgi:putative transposase